LSVDIHQSCWLFFFFYYLFKSYVAFLSQFGFDVGAYSGSPSLSTVRHLLKIDFSIFHIVHTWSSVYTKQENAVLKFGCAKNN
jgi:hypothetical protein